MDGWRVRGPQACQVKTREDRTVKQMKEATGPSLSARTLHFWDCLSWLPWPVGRVCAGMQIPSGPSAAGWSLHSGVALESPN